jgi:glucosamine--fructose-6-phosphate aminotransferase (isomerizing)
MSTAMQREMDQQPAVLRALAGWRDVIIESVQALAPEPAGTAFVARGSSACAAQYGRHAMLMATGRPSMIASLSMDCYEQQIDYRGWLSIGASQSGQTPEIVTALAGHAAGGARTIAVTNVAGSPLGLAADLTFDIGAGPEHAVPATKSVTATMTVLAMIAEALRGGRASLIDWPLLADTVEQCLADAPAVDQIVERVQSAHRMIVAGRGFGFGAAREGALKIKEVTGISAEASTHLEFLHGPIASADPHLPAIVVVLDGPTRHDGERLIAELRERGAPCWTVGDVPGADVRVPPGLPECLMPIAVVVRMQQIAHALGIALGVDPDQPHRLSKVTMT